MAEEEKRREPRRWTAERRAVFLETLAETCCVARAAEAVGATPSTAYSLKLRDAKFAAEWQEAIAIGYTQVEERLILDATGRAANDEAGAGVGDGVRMDKYEREQALNLLKWHRAEAVGAPRRGGTPGKFAPTDETDAAILARLAAVRKRMGR